MKKISPKGKPNKTIKFSLSEAEKERFKAFCKLMDMNYSEVFRAMSNDFIKKKAKELKLDIKCAEPELFENTDKKTNKQTELWKK